MTCYQEYDRWTIEDKEDLERFAQKFKVRKEPIVDGRFNLNIDSVRQICARITECDLVVFEENENLVIMEFGI
ncbi:MULTISPECIES: hypothetical protein [Methanobacterium]|uniref:Uncharacterized protein n=1 Tax=Methanobacterium bryantii TaxID=2161 RepID=A0A2A2H8J8_METBR|nr:MULTISPECIES: hypothetical protein [Methanobacterium]OEC87865.1 hypothetical protein A9507_06735 [Methanobacterium sp. A39]PAV05732.1 hypothetical protein ASJ80_08345 [Methanobacterium bryantii]